MTTLWLILFDVFFVGILLLLLLPLAKFKRAAFAVLKRNFVGYFSNPTGYVFLCLFVLLTSIAAFWPHDFWVANLANLDQLNIFLPYIMLVFIPAITMSIWAEEKRQGTDELLLTLPADDFDIVVGKYLAAAAIFTASLLFSQISSSMVLIWLTSGDLDLGLLMTTYLGYWFIGLAMLAIGMIASFLTSNLTVGFILGAALNLPLAFAVRADVIIPQRGAISLFGWEIGWPTWDVVYTAISRWSFSSQFEGFGRGVVNVSSVSFFAMLVAIGLYVSMILIGRRHWSGGRDGTFKLGHYIVRVIALVVVAAGVNLFFTNHDVIRIDATSQKISSLSPHTEELLDNLDAKHTIYIDAYLSEKVPDSFVQTKYDLLSMLKEFRALSDSTITVRIYDNLEPSSEEAAQAEERYGIRPQMVRTFSQGAIRDEEVLLGAAFTCGLEKVVVPFFEPGVAVEYELVRSINTVVKPNRGRLGVVRTDAQLSGGFSMAGGMPRQIPRQEILDELEKQYDIEEINPAEEIDTDKFDVMMVVQPSSLDPMGLDNVMAAIRKGLPTAVFEDPRPVFLTSAPATGEPKQAPGGMFGGGQAPPKCDITQLWDLLGLDIPGERGDGFPPLFQPDVVWQKYNPYPKLAVAGIPDEWVFASPAAPEADEAFNMESKITSGLDQVLFPVPGTIEKVRSSKLDYVELVKTGSLAGTTKFSDFMEQARDPEAAAGMSREKEGEQVLAVRITGELDGAEGDDADSDEDAESTDESDADDANDENADDSGESDTNDAESEDADQEKKRSGIDVIYVADIDLMISAFVRIRARPGEFDDIEWRFENVVFLLNVVDSLSGDDDYVEIRKRKLHHSTLKAVEYSTRNARDRETVERKRFQDKFEKALEDAKEENQKIEDQFQQAYDKLVERRQQGEPVNPADIRAANTNLLEQKALLERRLAVTEEKLKRERDLEIKKIGLEVDREIKSIQKFCKYLAVIIPPIPPLVIGLIVFVMRRLREREGVAKSRMRY